ncbi:MAG: CsgG/HfaB family protein [Myxococcota bacterium]
MARLVVAALLLSSAAIAAPDAGPPEAPRIAVLYFTAALKDPELEAFTKGLSALLISDLSANPQLRVIERERLEDVLAELKLGETRFADRDSFSKIGNALGAKFLLVGTLAGAHGKYRISTRLIDTSTFDDVRGMGAKVDLDPADVFAATDALVEQLNAKLASARSLPPPAAPAKKAALPLKSAVKYSRALDAKDKKDPAGAKKLLGEVVAEQPDFKLAQLDLLSLTR